MKTIRIKAKQNMVNYKRPMCYISGETYPLPPYSTIIGMVHNACGFTSYHPMKVSVQGISKGVVCDLQTKYSGGTMKYESGRHTVYCIGDDNKKIGYTKGPGSVELITDIDLIIHILPDDEKELENICDALKNPQKYLALGRHEDILNITNVDIVECQEINYAYTTNDMYYYQNNEELLNEIDSGTIYKIKKVYSINPKTNLRSFPETYKVNYLVKGTSVDRPFVDDEKNVVCFV